MFDNESPEFPVEAVLRVRCNPNFSSFSWIATSTQSGVVRLHCVSGMLDNREVAEALKQYKSNM